MNTTTTPMPTALYKILVRGAAADHPAWSLPTEGPEGTVTPGAWQERREGDGWSLTAEPRTGLVPKPGCRLYLAEPDGEPACVREGVYLAGRARLVREVSWADWGVYYISEGSFDTGALAPSPWRPIVVASGDSIVSARGNSHVYAGDDCHVYAWGESRVTTHGRSHVATHDYSEVVAWGETQVDAWGCSRVSAHGHTRVVARESCQVEAYGSAEVLTPPHKLEKPNTASVTVTGEAVHIDRRGRRVVVTLGGGDG